MKRSRMNPRKTRLRSQKAEIPRTTRVRRRNRRRSAAAFERAYGGKERADWIARQPCVACGRVPADETPSVNAHIKSGGTGRKADARYVVPLCDPCHREQHDGVQSFEARWGIDLTQLADVIDGAWLAFLATREAA